LKFIQHILLTSALAYTVVCSPFLLRAQPHEGETILTTKAKAEIVNRISGLLLDNYVYPDTARRMSNLLKQKQKDGAYRTITDPIAFSDALTADLYSVYHDRHLLVQYNPAFEAQLRNPVQATTATREDPLRRIREANFGLSKVEILNGNIGYIHLERFWADNVYGKETVKAALQFVRNTNALIIDVRTNGGGSPETVAMICSYFFDQKIHINDSYSRPGNTTTEFWSTPDSTLPELVDIPLYILTSNRTFSAAEEFAYDLQQLKRATIVGETTGGAAHNTFEQAAGHGFVLHTPYGRAINAVTHTNWEGAGVRPDIAINADLALETAEMKIFETLLNKTSDPAALFELNWQLDLLKAINHPITLDTLTLRKYAGVYGDRVFTYEDGKLFYQRTGRPKFELEAITPTLMKGKGNTFFKISFSVDDAGEVNEIKAYYQNRVVESAVRTR